MKKILFAAFAAATIGLAGYNVIESIQTAELSDLALKNIEALADDENNPDKPKTIEVCLAIWGSCINDVKAPYAIVTL